MSYTSPKITEEMLQDTRRALSEWLTRETGTVWTYTPDPTHYFENKQVKREDGIAITVSTEQGNTGKLVIGGYSNNYSEAPRYATENARMPEIAVSYSRGFETLTKEIQRRFLTDFYKAIDAANAWVIERDTKARKTQQAMDSIVAALGKHYNHTRNGDWVSLKAGNQVMIDAGNVNRLDTDIQINSANSIKFTLNYLKTSEAVKVAAFIAKLAEEEEK